MSAAICSDSTRVLHYFPRGYVGGIVEYMSLSFLRKFFPHVYTQVVSRTIDDIRDDGMGRRPWVNFSHVDFSKYPHVQEISCVSLSDVISRARIDHINYFILDVEGAELEVLQSIDWNKVTFDVMAVETEERFRWEGFTGEVTSFLRARGYHQYSELQGRNHWYFISSIFC